MPHSWNASFTGSLFCTSSKAFLSRSSALAFGSSTSIVRLCTFFLVSRIHYEHEVLLQIVVALVPIAHVALVEHVVDPFLPLVIG